MPRAILAARPPARKPPEDAATAPARRRGVRGGSVRARAIAPWLRRAWVGYRAASHGGADEDAVLGMRIGSRDGATGAHRLGLSPVPLSRVRQAVQRASGGALNRTQYPSDLIALVVLWRLRYKLALRDLPEMFAIRGIVFSYEAVREWEAKLTPALAEELRKRRR